MHTRLGDAHMKCGRAAGAPCGLATKLEFERCTSAISSYIDSGVRNPDPPKATDAAVRALVNNMAPPSGSTWLIGCAGIDSLGLEAP
jgi:hypothetical protein